MTDEPAAPQLSVVIPVRNGATTLAAQLNALVACQPPGVTFEVVVADNGSTDETAEIARAYADRLPIAVIDAGRAPGINVARNDGVAAARGGWILLCDADDEADQGWLLTMCAAFSAGGSLLGGTIDYTLLNSSEVQAWRGATQARVVNHLGYLPFAHGANIGFTRHLFETIEGFDEGFIGGGDDVDFCWRAQLAGFELREVPSSIMHYRLRPTLGDLWRQYVRYGASEARLFRTFRHAGMPRRPWRQVVRAPWWLLSRLPLVVSRGRRGAWVRVAALAWGRVIGSFSYRTVWL